MTDLLWRRAHDTVEQAAALAATIRDGDHLTATYGTDVVQGTAKVTLMLGAGAEVRVKLGDTFALLVFQDGQPYRGLDELAVTTPPSVGPDHLTYAAVVTPDGEALNHTGLAWGDGSLTAKQLGALLPLLEDSPGGACPVTVTNEAVLTLGVNKPAHLAQSLVEGWDPDEVDIVGHLARVLTAPHLLGDDDDDDGDDSAADYVVPPWMKMGWLATPGKSTGPHLHFDPISNMQAAMTYGAGVRVSGLSEVRAKQAAVEEALYQLKEAWRAQESTDADGTDDD